MATKMGYAPGVQIQLRDNSAYQVVENPNTVAGIVGYASKGEMNKIISVANTGELGVKLGYGYQSYKYNQGMYAANAVLTAGGEVEFVRPYGEEISRTDAYKRDLKTDAFVVAFDKNAALYTNDEPKTSFNVKHFAATRYKTDGAAEFGVTRKINNIAETVESGSNVQFNVDASESFEDSKASRWYDKDHCTDMVLFAIMNRDPSYANRAYDRYEVMSHNRVAGSENLIECTLPSKPIFSVGDEVFLPATSQKVNQYGNAGTSATSIVATVVDIDDKVVILDVGTDYGTSEPDVIIYSDADNAIADGFDYLNIKTAVAGNTVKNFTTIKWGTADGAKPDTSVVSGTKLEFVKRNGGSYYVRIFGGVNGFTVSSDPEHPSIAVVEDGRIKVDIGNVDVLPGDELTIEVAGLTYNFIVDDIIEENAIGKAPVGIDTDAELTYTALSFSNMVANNEDVFVADIRAIESDSTLNNWSYVVGVISDTMRLAGGYSKVPVVNDIIKAEGKTVTLDSSSVYDYSIGDQVAIIRGSNAFDDSTTALAAAFNGKVYKIASLNPMNGSIILDMNGTLTTIEEDGSDKFQLINLTTTNATLYSAVSTYTDNEETFDVVDMYLVSSYSMYVNRTEQSKNPCKTLSDTTSSLAYIQTDANVFIPAVTKSPTVLADSDIGASFMALGLARNQYIDLNFDGNPMQVFTLTDDGIAVARMYLGVRYRFNGTMYEFEGTIVPYNYNRRQLSIVDAAKYELQNSGLEFVINDSGVLDFFMENNSYDLSQTIQNGSLNGSYLAIAYNQDDPAIINDAVWTYNPQNNNSGSTLATVWSLFTNKDGSDVDMLVAAGMGINNAFARKYETLNYQVMQAMINVCESRKDCFCIFDGVYEPDINKAVQKMTGAGHLSLGRWGALYDGRGVFTDSLYTDSQVDVMKSVQLAAIITANRQGGIWWIPPAGDEAYVPAAWGTEEKFTRSYDPESKTCDHAKLSGIHVNATRVNKDGIRIWGDFTLQMETTAFNQIHVTMLVAGIHKAFYKYLDHKVFKLNTTVLRTQVTSDLQDKLNDIKRRNPAGLIDGKVVCDNSNNTPDIIEQNLLIVDLKLLPPKSTRWIILRTSVESTDNGKVITTQIL